MGSCWYLEHVTTRDRIVLNKGENLLGRHSTCKITIKEPYDFVSRVHVKMTVLGDAGVLVQSMNTSNGVFINEQKMKDQTTRTHVVAGTVISLGVEGHITNAPRNFPIFVLRKVATEAEEIVLSSDDDDDANPGQLNPDLSSIKRDLSDQENHPSSTYLHLPKIPEVKQEMVSKTTEEITNIFGTADEAILGSVMDINPYLYNQLNKQFGGTAFANAKIHDGDVIELDMDADREKKQPPPLPGPLDSVDDEYDEQFAISQAVLQGMKAEMAFSDGEEDFLSSNVMEVEALLGSPSNQGNFDVIIIISESEDDELYDKVADWSKKLLSKKDPDPIEMSQVYPLDEDQDQEIDSRFGMKKPPRSLYIDISSDEESNNPDLCIVNSTTTSPSGPLCPQPFAREVSSTDDALLFMRRQKVISEVDQENWVPDSTSKSNEQSGTQKCLFSEPICSKEYKKETFSEKGEEPKLTSTPLHNRSISFYMERPIDIDEALETKDINEKQGDSLSPIEPIEEVEDCREELLVTLHAPEEPEETPIKKNKPRTRQKATNSRKEDELMKKAPPKNGQRITPRKQHQDEPASTAQTQTRPRSARLLNRSRSCYAERPIDIYEFLDSSQTNEDIKEKQKDPRTRKRQKSIEKDCDASKKTPPKKSEGNKSKKNNNSHEKIEEIAKNPKNNRDNFTPRNGDTPDTAPEKNGKRISPRKQDQDEPAAQTQTRQRSARLQNRLRSCYAERPIEMYEFLESNPTNEDIQEKQKDPPSPKRQKSIEKDCDASKKKQKTPPKKSEANKSNQTNNSQEEIEEIAKIPKNNRDSVTQRKWDTPDSTALKNGNRISPRKPDQDEPAVQTQAKNRSARLLNRSRSCYAERPIEMDEFLDSKQTNEDIKEKQRDPPNKKRHKSMEKDCDASKKKQKTPPKKSEANKSKTTKNSHEEFKEIPKIPKNNRDSVTPRNGDTPDRAAQNNEKSISPRKEDQDEPAAETQAKHRSARLQSRSRSYYVERPIEIDEFLDSKLINEDIQEKQKDLPNRKRQKSTEKDSDASKKKQKTPPKKSEGNKSSEKNISQEEIEERAKITKNNRDSVTPRKGDTLSKKDPSPRLQSRSKSCIIDPTDNIVITNENSPAHSDAATGTKTTKDAKLTPGPAIIEASFMSKNRCKVNKKDNQRVIDRQRFVNYQAEINAKWNQKPKDKKKDDKVIKEKRREALKKLSDKTKEEGNSPSTSNANKRKNCTSVPTVSNTNRGEFLTKGIDSGPPTKIAKKVEKPQVQTPPTKNSVPQRRSTIETDDPANFPQPHCSRPPERRDAQEARNQRTCNRVNFADMERYHQKVADAKKIEKRRRNVNFRDEEEIKYIDRVFGANKPVRKNKDSLKICLSTYSERREWTLQGSNMLNDMLYHKRTILTWANQWLRHGSVEAVVEKDVLMPISFDFTSSQHYRETFLPLIKLELLTTIERDYKSLKTTLNLEVTDVDSEKEYYRISTKANATPAGKFELYTLSSGTQLVETFATLLEAKTVSGGVCFMKFEVLMQLSFERMKSLKQLTVRPVVDSLRVELGALSAIHQLHRSPLSRRILMPTEAVKTIPIPKVAQAFTYTGFTKLSQHQEDICIRIYKRVIDNVNPSVTLVQGPPGTGKSLLLSNLSLQCLYGKASVMLDRKILICAHSNTAVDNMVKALSKALFAMSHDHFQLLRFGMTEKMSENSRQFSISEHLKRARIDKLKRLAPESIELLKKQLSDLCAEIQQLKQNANPMTTYLQHQLDQKQKQLLLISEQLNPPLTQREEYDIAKTCVKRAHIVCTTLSSCVKLANYVDFFDICIIDEATQCTEPWTLLPMRFGIKHLVLVGDTQQLPAVVLSKKAIDFGLGNSMFDRIQKSLVKQLDMDMPGGNQLVHTKLFKLSMQYRMHPEICRWPNKYFYEDQLVSADLTAKPSPLIPYCVINLSYTRYTGGTTGNGSINNDEEAHFVAQLLTEMDKHMPSKRFSYGLISPYHHQCHALSQVIPHHMNLTPQTVDSYQGLEKDVIIISNARTRGCGSMRLNVALTRPKRCLIICGNFDDLQSSDTWRQLLDDARQRKVYFDLKRDDLNDLQCSLMENLLMKPRAIGGNY